MNPRSTAILALLALAIGGHASPAGAAPAFDPESQRILQGMSDFIAATDS